MNLNGRLYEDLKKEKTKIAKKVWDDLDNERYWCVITYGCTDVWNFEHNSTSTVPNYAWNYLVRYIYRHYGISYFFFGRFENYKDLIKKIKGFNRRIRNEWN